jgi:hypothetical protein
MINLPDAAILLAVYTNVISPRLAPGQPTIQALPRRFHHHCTSGLYTVPGITGYSRPRMQGTHALRMRTRVDRDARIIISKFEE